MNYYRFYVGDYIRDTSRLSMLEHGAYCLMLHYYYAEERPLPLALDEIYTMVRAMTPDGRKAVDKVLAKYFKLQDDGYHNGRADIELGIASKAIETAKENGKLGGRPKQTKNETKGITKTGTEIETTEKPNGLSVGSEKGGFQEPRNNHPPTSNLQPPTSNLQPPTSSLQPPGKSSATAESVDNSKASLRGALSAALRAEGVTVTPSNPLLVQWIERGVTVHQAREAVDIAREHKPKPEKIPAAYLDPIIAELLGGGRAPVSKVNGVPAGEWWHSWDGIQRKATELGVTIPSVFDGREMVQGERFTWGKCAIAAKIGLGPWIDQRNMTEMRIYKRFMEQGQQQV